MKPKLLEGLVEVDETFFARSEKGKKDLTGRKTRKRGMKAKLLGRSATDWVPVFTVRDRAQHTFDNLLGISKRGDSHLFKDAFNTRCQSRHPKQ